MTLSDGDMSYLDRASAIWKPVLECKNQADELDEVWKSLVPKELREYALQKKEARTIESYLIPVETLAQWNWETLRDLLLKREDTTLEDLRDYIEYKDSGSNKRYIAPKDRAQAKAWGIQFWRDDDDL
jgi:hypothetical protein